MWRGWARAVLEAEVARWRRCAARGLLGVGDEREDHPVEVVEEADEVEAELDEALFLVRRERAEDFCGVERVVFVHDLVHVEGDERRVEQERNPLPAEQEEEREHRVRRHLGQDELWQCGQAEE